MTTEEINKLEEYFTCYSTGPYSSSYERRPMCRRFFHKEGGSFHIIIFDDNKEVYQADTDGETFGIELMTMNDLIIRFESFSGDKIDNITTYEEDPLELTYEERVELLHIKRRKESASLFVSPGIFTTEPGPSEEYLDQQGIPRFMDTEEERERKFNARYENDTDKE